MEEGCILPGITADNALRLALWRAGTVQTAVLGVHQAGVIFEAPGIGRLRGEDGPRRLCFRVLR